VVDPGNWIRYHASDWLQISLRSTRCRKRLEEK
jgi:hypothetical protein